MCNVRVLTIGSGMRVFADLWRKSFDKLPNVKSLQNELPNKWTGANRLEDFTTYSESVSYVSDPWSSLHKVAKFLADGGFEFRRSNFLVAAADAFMAFPGAVSTRMDGNGKHVIMLGETASLEELIDEAVWHALRGSHVTVLSNEDAPNPVLVDLKSPIQWFHHTSMSNVQIVQTAPLTVARMLSSFRLIRAIKAPGTQPEHSENAALAFLQPKESSLFERESLGEFLEIVHGLTDLVRPRPINLVLGTALTSDMIKHVALNAAIGGKGNVQNTPLNSSNEVKQFSKFVQKQLGYTNHDFAPDACMRIDMSTKCDPDPFMLASQHLVDI